MNDSPAAPDDQHGDQAEQFATLAAALSAHDISLADSIVEQLDAYRRELWVWNEKLNLTRHTTLAKFVGRDIVDSVQLAAQIRPAARVLDIGSGGGVPGLVLAILRPDLQVSVCDSVAKKSRVLQQLVATLDLPVHVYAARAQEVLELAEFDVLVARAVASLRKMLTWLEPYWDAFDELLLVKGRKWVDERGEARHHGLMHGKQLRRVASFHTRDTGESVILRIQSVGGGN